MFIRFRGLIFFRSIENRPASYSNPAPGIIHGILYCKIAKPDDETTLTAL